MAQRLAEIALLGREITDAVTGAFEKLDKGSALVALIPRLLVMDQDCPPLPARHTAINTAEGAAAPTPTNEHRGVPLTPAHRRPGRRFRRKRLVGLFRQIQQRERAVDMRRHN